MRYPMSKECPNCRSLDVRRSRFQRTGERRAHRFQSPYRCKECGTRFWRISHEARRGITALFIVIVPLIALATGWWLTPSEEAKKQEPTPGVKDAIELPHVRIEQDALR